MEAFYKNLSIMGGPAVVRYRRGRIFNPCGVRQRCESSELLFAPSELLLAILKLGQRAFEFLFQLLALAYVA